MIFRKNLADLIISGEKTVTRRAVNPDNENSPWFKGGCAYELGQTFTVNPGRGVYRVAEALITETPYQEELGDVTDQQARLEGFVDRNDFLSGFSDINGDVNLKQRVWVLPFRRTAVTQGAIEAGTDIGGNRLIVIAPSIEQFLPISRAWRAARSSRRVWHSTYAHDPCSLDGLRVDSETRVIEFGLDRRNRGELVQVLNRAATKCGHPLNIIQITEGAS